MKPIFIFSLPRSGSTLLQRLLVNHAEISTVSEPWILLPLLEMTSDENVVAKYSHGTCSQGIEDFICSVEKSSNYNKILKDFIMNLYSAASEDSRVNYFIDKTPRYYYIINKIIDLFPEAKFIFLVRHPIQVYSSVLETWSGGKYRKLYRYIDDLYLGPEILMNALDKYRNQSCLICYDDLVSDSQAVMKQVMDYLELDFQQDRMLDLSMDNIDHKRLGDPTGRFEYHKISNASTLKWKKCINGIVRKMHAKKYLKTLGREVEIFYDYNLDDTIKEIEEINNSRGFFGELRDVFDIVSSELIYRLKLNLLISNTKERKDFNGFFD